MRDLWFFEIPLVPGAWQSEAAPAGRIHWVVWERGREGCAGTAAEILCSLRGWERCSESALRRAEQRSGASAAAAAQGRGHLQSVQARGAAGPAASTDNASTEPADLVLC